MGKSTGTGGGGGGGKGRGASGGGFTAEESRGINSTVDKLRSLPADQRQKQIDRAESTVRKNLQDATDKKNEALRRQAEFKRRNPQTPDSRNHWNNDVKKTQERVEQRQKEFQRFREVKKRLS